MLATAARDAVITAGGQIMRISQDYKAISYRFALDVFRRNRNELYRNLCFVGLRTEPSGKTTVIRGRNVRPH